MKAKLPHFVISRLGQGAAPGVHPDADLLAAFSEGALSDGERAEVTAHLAACADCRACLALALAAEQPVTVPQAEPALGRFRNCGRNWFSVLRWALPALAACAALVLVVKQAGERQRPVLQARNRAAQAAPAHAGTSHAVARSAAQSEHLIVRPPAALSPDRAGKPAASPGHADRVQSSASLPSQKSRFGSAAGEQRYYIQQPAQWAAGQVPVSSKAWKIPSVAGRKAEQDGVVAKAGSVAAVPAAVEELRASAQQLRLAKASPPQRIVAPPAGGILSTATLQLNPDQAEGADALQAGGAGQLQTKLDAPAAASALRGGTATAPRDRWTIRFSIGRGGTAHGQVYKRTAGESDWRAVSISDEISLLTVTAAGPEVWVGGDGGALFHSSDAGLRWERVSVITMAAKLTDSIVRINARTPGRVQVTTNTGDVWVREDGLWRRALER